MRTCGKADIARSAFAPEALCGEVDRPLPIWSIDHDEVPRGVEGVVLADVRSRQIWCVPEYQVVTRIALSFASDSSPKVATARWQSGITPPSSRSRRPTEITSYSPWNSEV